MFRRRCLSIVFAGLLTVSLSPILGTLRGEEPKKVATVSVEVDYGDGASRRFGQLAFKDGDTVHEATLAATRHPRGIKCEIKGTGGNAFLVSIDDVKNEGTGKNWIFYVNDKKADRGMGVFKLKAGDSVAWKFESYDE